MESTVKATQSTGKGLHKVFDTVAKEILQELTALGESGSEVSHFILEPRNFAEVTKLSEKIKKPWLKENLKEIKNLINNQNFMIEDQYGCKRNFAGTDSFGRIWFRSFPFHSRAKKLF